MKSITKKISNYNFSSRNGQSITYIVLHFTGNTNDTALNNANYFGGGNRDASAHYFVDDGNIVQVVDDINASWNCGDGNGAYGITNQNSIAIEMCGTDGDISAATENNTMELIRYLMDKYNVSLDRVVRHYDASRKICPSPWSGNNWAKWYEFKNEITGSKSDVSEPTPVSAPDIVYQTYAGGGWLPKVTNTEDFADMYGYPIMVVYADASHSNIHYRVHLTNGSWLPYVFNMTDFAGASYLNKSIDGIQMQLTDLPGYGVEYRAHIYSGWLPWVRDLADFAGIYGINIDGIQARAYKK